MNIKIFQNWNYWHRTEHFACTHYLIGFSEHHNEVIISNQFLLEAQRGKQFAPNHITSKRQIQYLNPCLVDSRPQAPKHVFLQDNRSWSRGKDRQESLQLEVFECPPTHSIWRRVWGACVGVDCKRMITYKTQLVKFTGMNVLIQNSGFNALAQVLGDDEYLARLADWNLGFKTGLQLMKLKCQNSPGTLGRCLKAQGSGSIEKELLCASCLAIPNCTPGQGQRTLPLPRHALMGPWEEASVLKSSLVAIHYRSEMATGYAGIPRFSNFSAH